MTVDEDGFTVGETVVNEAELHVEEVTKAIIGLPPV
jgi:hypothetical protein